MARSLGFSVRLCLVSGHVYVAVKMITPPTHNSQYPSRWYLNISGDYYYTCETTGYGWRIGDLPADYHGQSIYIYPLD